jgi:ABC-type transport system involved in multi-copper enzyme maturation permease subunit
VTFSRRRVGAIFHKELREFRRRRSLIVAAAIFPLVFLIQPLALVFLVPSDTAQHLSNEHLLLYMLAIPILTSPMLSAGSVAGEREQGSLEPVLTTPIPGEEFLLAKALAALLPAITVAYAVYALFIGCVVGFAQPGVAGAILRVPDMIAQVLYTPLLAGCAIWIGIAVSTRFGDLRVAQQISLLCCLPLVLITSLVAFDVIQVTPGLAIACGAGLLAVDILGWRLVSPMFNRERLITARL